jgi:hypothetical protein
MGAMRTRLQTFDIQGSTAGVLSHVAPITRKLRE